MKSTLAGVIDHTNLRPDATEKEIVLLCREAREYGFYSACLNPSFVKKAAEVLAGSLTRVSAVIGFPLGASLTRVKIYEAVEAVLDGADELDVVMNLGRARVHDWKMIESEISDIVSATPGVTHKIIIETAYLTDHEIRRATEAVMRSGGEFVKTSTGLAHAGATVKDVKLIQRVTKGAVGIKAAGGIRTLRDVKALLAAGATRIGTSSGVQILKEAGGKRQL